PGLFQQQAQFGVGVGRSEVLKDVMFALGVLGDLDRGRPGFGPYSPDEGHPVTVEQPSLVRENDPSRARTTWSRWCHTVVATPQVIGVAHQNTTHAHPR